MFNFSAFSSNQNSSPVRAPSNKPLQNASPSYVPIPQPNQSTWESSSYLPNPHQEHPIKEEIPYNIRVLLENEQETSSTSSDSEATDTMPDVAARFKKTAVREWDFGQEEMGRRKSEIVMPTNSLLQNAMGNLEQANQRTWAPFLPGRVSVKQSLFGPLNLNEFAQNEKKAYFITIEGFHPLNSRRLFKLERLCHAMQSKISQVDSKQFLYLGLWNDWHNSQEETDNLFEPWIYAVPYLNFRLVVKIHLSHSFEDPYSFDFLVDVRQFALPTKDKRIQSLEVAYVEQENSASPGVSPNITNNLSIHLQLTNEKLILPQGFRNQESKSDSSTDFNVILRQIIIGLPLTRNTNNVSPISPLLPQNIHRLHDVYGKRGSAISLGQDHKHHTLLDAPQSPISWSNFSRDGSPSHSLKFASPKQPTQADPLMPPGIMKNNSNPSKDQNNYMPGGSLFKFNHNRQQRYSIQPIRREPDEAQNSKRMSSDLSYLLQGDKSPLKVLEAYVQAYKGGHRKESNATESTNTTNMSNMSNFSMMGRFQQPITEVEGQSQSTSTLTASEYEEAVPEVVPADEETIIKSQTDIGDDFRIEDYIGKMVEYAKTYQGSKVLQKYVATAAKDDLDVVIREIGEKIGELMLDPYANYMIQTLVQSGYPRQRLYLLQKIAPSFTSIARDKKGTHSLQAIVAQIDSPDEFALMKTIMSPYVFELSMDPRANYVIQKLINIIPIDSSNFLYQPLFDNFVQVANNSFGLLVLKQMMAKVEQKEALKNKVVELTSINFEKLIQNPYGNYAIQHIVEYYPKESLLIMNKIVTKIIPYSSQKISSNVIEKCLTVCDSQFRKRVVDEILKNGRLGDLMKNKYGNFVTLQLLATSATIDKQRLMQEIFKFANSFNGTKYKTRWLKFIQDNPMKINWDNSISSEQEEGNKSDDSDIFSKERVANGDPELNSKIETEKLEAVKKIWREMTKEEKSDTSPFHYTAKNSTNKKYYNKRDDTYAGRGDK